MTAISLDDVKIRILAPTRRKTSQGLGRIIVTATHPVHGTLGKLDAYKFPRAYPLRGRFFEVLDEESGELADFGMKVLDNDMNAYPKIVDDEYHKGTGVWGWEMNKGNVLYVPIVQVEKKFENQGIATRLLKTLLSSKHVEQDAIVYCWPTPVATRSVEEHKAEIPRVTHVCRKAGFRRVGRTNYFAYSPHPAHPSRALPEADDLDLDAYKFPMKPFTYTSEDMVRLRTNFPLQILLDPPLDRDNFTNPDYEAPRQLSAADMATFIQGVHAHDPNLLHVQDDQGFTPLYAAAKTGNLPAIHALLSHGVSPDEVTSHDNAADRNVLEALQQHLLEDRKMSALFSRGPWQGYSHDALVAGHKLCQAAGQKIGTLPEYIAQNRWGCTCGKCLGGWLSPRMQYALIAMGDLSFDMGMQAAEYTFADGADPSEILALPRLDYIPDELQQSTTRAFYTGFLTLCRALARVVEAGLLPTADRIYVELTNDQTPMGVLSMQTVQYYLSHAGKVEWAMHCVLDVVKEHMTDYSWDEMYEEDEEWNALPRCVNDAEFGLVGRLMGLGRRMGSF
ncbi:hypothetical protein K523DRAFT_230666 [Schizophyllum commune Tattone D]|nr:hypothetical protein K523DRAFT_230666 [Schizophyllum commune Tattone D]